MKDKPKDITFHYTNEQMVKDLLKIIPFEKDDVALDAGSGKNKVWYNNIPELCHRYECELEDGNNFLEWDKKVDWVIGNPPFATNEIINGRHQNLIPQWIEHSSNIANKGMAFLFNHKVINFLTPVRLEKLKEKDFEITVWHIVADKRWFGRYYFLIFEKKRGILIN